MEMREGILATMILFLFDGVDAKKRRSKTFAALVAALIEYR